MITASLLERGGLAELLICISLVVDHDEHSFIDCMTETCILLSIKNYLLFSLLLLLSFRLLIYPGYEFHVWYFQP